MDFALTRAGGTIYLNGAGVSAPVRAGRAELGQAGAAVLEVALDGTASAIAGVVQSVERLLYLAERVYGLPGEDWGYLRVTLPEGGSWQAPICAGRAEAVTPGARAGGSMGLKISLKLAGYWESTTLSDLPLSNSYGTNVVGGHYFYNHSDSGHQNFVNISAGVVLGDVPAPAVVTFGNAGVGGMDVLLSMIVDGNAAFSPVFEGEAATPGAGVANVSTADATCSEANYGAVSWAGTNQVVFYWQLSAAQTGYFAGRMYRPVLRLRDLVAGGEKIWANFGTAYGGTGWNLLNMGDGLLLPTDSRMIVFPPLAIPPWPKGRGTYEQVVLAVYLQAEAAGAHALALDYALAHPCDGWVRFLPAATLTATTDLVFDGATRAVSRAGSVMATHVAEGPGLWVYPGLGARVIGQSQAAPLCTTSWINTIRVQYRARKRAL